MELENRIISAEWLKTRCYEICDEYNTEHLYIDRIIDEIDEAPDVELVRCKDCKHYRNHPNGLCYLHTEPYANERGYKGDAVCVEPDDFCSYGERKDND